MKTALILAALAAAAVAMPAHAVTFFSIPGAVDPGLAPGEHLLVDFNGGALPIGVTETNSGTVGLYTAPLVSGVAAPPAGDTTQYLAVGGGGSATFDFTGYFAGKHVRTISVYVGSVDTYNHIQILSTSGSVIATINGADFPATGYENGNQTSPGTNRRLYISFTNAENVGGLKFLSDSAAFEFDDIAVSSIVFAPIPPVAPGAPADPSPPALPPIASGGGSLVPEPAAWAMMIAGFGLVGAANRRRRAAVAA